jgi:hypothetical protein
MRAVARRVMKVARHHQMKVVKHHQMKAVRDRPRRAVTLSEAKGLGETRRSFASLRMTGVVLTKGESPRSARWPC